MGRRISVTVKANAKALSVVKMADGAFFVSVREPARDGAANRELITSLARYFDVPKSTIRVIRGHRSRYKIIELD